MREAMVAGLAVGTVNSGNIDEPGTAVFLVSSPSRKNGEDIALQVILSGDEVILAGGERWGCCRRVRMAVMDRVRARTGAI